MIAQENLVHSVEILAVYGFTAGIIFAVLSRFLNHVIDDHSLRWLLSFLWIIAIPFLIGFCLFAFLVIAFSPVTGVSWWEE